jgi:transcriptional regulator GlxA family with amidase domain
MEILYFKMDVNFQTCASIQAKIDKIDALIDSLFAASIKVAATSAKASYKIDDGQTVQEVVYTTPLQIQKSIQAYEKQRQYYINQLAGNAYQNVGSKNLRGRKF